MTALNESNDRGRVGRYRILGTLGQGGMGCLYLARSEGPGGFERLAALKMIHEHLSREPTFVQMFLEEARIAARIHHPNVVTVYEIGQHESRYFIAMDYIHGETLQLTLSRAWKVALDFPLDLAAHILMNTAEGLHQAHELTDARGAPLGVVHRDVSPGNVMVGYDGTVRVMDFGVAKAADNLCRTQPGVAKGKAPYMAPEQVLDQAIDRRVDVFALGILLWEATVGKRLFKASSDAATIARIMNGRVTRPSLMRPNYPPQLERIVLKALMPRREDRYPTARALALDLRAFLESTGRLLSAVDVEAYMRTTFPDRLASRISMLSQASAADPPAPTRTSPEFLANLDALLAEELEDSGLEATIAVPLSPAPADSAEIVAPTTDDMRAEAAFLEPVPRVRGRAAVMVVALFAAGVAVSSMFGGSGSEESLDRARPVVASASAPPPDPSPALARVVVSFQVTPASASIEVDGRPLGGAGALIVDRSERRYRVRVFAPGHQPVELEVTGDRSQRIEVVLERADKQRPARKRALRAKPAEKVEAPIDGLVGDGEL